MFKKYSCVLLIILFVSTVHCCNIDFASTQAPADRGARMAMRRLRECSATEDLLVLWKPGYVRAIDLTGSVDEEFKPTCKWCKRSLAMLDYDRNLLPRY